MKLDVDLGSFDPGAEDQPTESPFAPPPAPAAGFGDPTGRFQMRYWDGTSWTPHVVAANGDQGTDPI